MEPFCTFQVPKLVEESIVSLLLESFDHSVQVPLADVPQDLFTRISHLDVDNLLPGLDCSSKLRVDALTDKNRFDHG